MLVLIAAVLSVIVGLFAASKAARTSAGYAAPADPSVTAVPSATKAPVATTVPAATTAPTAAAAPTVPTTTGWSSLASAGLSSPWQAQTGYALKWNAVNDPGGQVPASYTIQTLQLNGVKVDQFTTTQTRALEYGKGGTGLHPGIHYRVNDQAAGGSSLGLGWIAKNLDETGNTAFIAQLEPLAQGMISEQNRQYGTYIYFTPFLNHHKWIGDAEYTLPLSSFAPQDNATNVNGVLFQQNLDGSRVPARLELRNDNASESVLVALPERGHQGILCARLGVPGWGQ